MPLFSIISMWVHHVLPIAMDKENVFGRSNKRYANAITTSHQVVRFVLVLLRRIALLCFIYEDTHCLSDRLLHASIYETFENKLNTSIWTMSPHVQITHRCYNRLSKTTPYLCFLPTNQTQRAYTQIGPFQPIK